MNISVNTYRPLIHTEYGANACKKYCLPPYVDASIRREPDLESKYPTISALCRGPKFAPRLFQHDRVIYMTIKGMYGSTEPHWKITAVLDVLKRCNSHEEGYRWFKNKELPTPKNCLVKNNPPLPITHSEGLGARKMKRIAEMDDDRREIILNKSQDLWDNEYWEKVKKYPVFIITRPFYVNYVKPIELYEKDMIEIFGKILYTRNPPFITAESYKKLLKFMNLKIGELIH